MNFNIVLHCIAHVSGDRAQFIFSRDSCVVTLLKTGKDETSVR